MNKFFAASAAANYDFDLRSGGGINALNEYINEELAYGARRSPWEHRNQSGSLVRMAGLRTAAEKATVRLGRGAKVSLPWNLNKGYKGWVEYSTPEAADEEVQRWKRWIGWMLAIDERPGEFPLLVALMRATQSERGLGSPYTTCQLRELAEKFHFSPGCFERILRTTEWQCNRFLLGFGLQFSRKRDWCLMATVLAPRVRWLWDEAPQPNAIHEQSTHSPARAGKRLAALVINARLMRVGRVALKGDALQVLLGARGLAWLRPLRRRGEKDIIEWVHPHSRETVAWAVSRSNTGEFTSLREALTVSDRLVRDRTDGVDVLIDPYTRKDLHGIGIASGFQLVPRRYRGHDVEAVYLVTHGGRSYHATPPWSGREMMARAAIKQAVEAWKAQDRAAALARRDFPHLLRENVIVLVTREDSYRAGNCQPGTEAWISQTGIGNGRWCVPASALLAYVGDNRVARVLAVADEAASRWLRQHQM